MSHPHHRAALLLALAVTLSPAFAAAQESDTDRATARALARDGKEALARRDYAGARDRFSRAHALIHAPTLLLGLGRAELGLGKLVAAEEIFRRIVREGAAPGSPEPFLLAVDEARVELAAVTPRLAWITLVVEGPRAPTVTVDGIAVSQAALGVRRPVDPGEHRVRAFAIGFTPREATVIAGEGEGSRLVLALLPTGDVPLLPARGEAHRRQRALGFASLGVGGAFVWTGVISGIVAVAQRRSLAGVCPQGNCPASQDGDVAGYRTAANLSTAALVVGGVTAAGLVLLATTPKRAVAIAPVIGAGSVAITGSF